MKVLILKLINAYLMAKYGIVLDSLVTYDPDTGARKTPMSSTGIDRAIEEILAQANARWIALRSVPPRLIAFASTFIAS